MRGSKAAGTGDVPSGASGAEAGMSLLQRGPERGVVEAALESARGLVTILELSRANVRPAHAELRRAEALLEEGDTGRAQESVERAERIATSLETDYRAALDAVENLRGYVARMRALKVSTEEEEKALAAVHARASSIREMEGLRVRDYAGARLLAEEAWARAHMKRVSSEQMADAIFDAELFVEGVAGDFPEGTVEPLEEARQLLAKAHREVAQGNLEMAQTDVSVAEKIAHQVGDRHRHALDSLEAVTKAVTGLRALGIPVTAITKSLESGRVSLTRGDLEEGENLFAEAQQEAVRVGKAYRGQLDNLTGAAKAVESMREEGLPTADAESALARGRAAMEAGNFIFAAACVEDVHEAVRRQRELRDRLETWLAESKAQISTLRDLGLVFVNDVEEMIGKAEEAFRRGDFGATSEDLRIASLLIKPALEGKGRAGADLAR